MQAPAGEFEAQCEDWVASGRIDDAGLLKAAVCPPDARPWNGDAVGTLVLITLYKTPLPTTPSHPRPCAQDVVRWLDRQLTLGHSVAPALPPRDASELPAGSLRREVEGPEPAHTVDCAVLFAEEYALVS